MGSIFNKSDILLPKTNIDMEKWAVIACDQFTSEPDFWDRVQTTVGDAPSTFHMILPEVWLEEVDEDAAAEEINETMAAYLQADIFRTIKDSFIYVERTLRNGKIRPGIVGAVDLEQYDVSPDTASALRASERIIAARLPSRVKIRRGAPLEMPHVLLLIDDPNREIIEPIGDGVKDMEQLYDFPLMEDCGHIRGYRLTGPAADRAAEAINQLEIILVGDGNHSLVAAKVAWDELKVNLTEAQRQNHPARYALAEINNVHDDSLEIEPIHRIVFDAPGDLIGDFIAKYPNVLSGEGAGYVIRTIDRGTPGAFTIQGCTVGETIDLLQEFLDAYVDTHGGAIDYIHGEENLEALAQRPGSIAFFMPIIEKSALFTSVKQGGVFPKKSFSMGEGADKRHYLECRAIG